MANLIAIRLYGSTSETAVTLVDEATLPRTISGLAAGDYEVGRTRIRWSGQKTTVYGPPPTPELLPLSFVATDARAQGTALLTFTRPWSSTPGAISIVAQNPAGAFQMNANGVTLEYGATMLDALQTQIVTLTLRYSDANGGPYDFSVSGTVRQSNAPAGGAFALDFDVTPDLIDPVVTLSGASVTATTVTVPVSLSEATGTLYYLNDPAASLSAAAIIAAGGVVTRSITASGAQADIALTGLTGGTTGRVHVVHKDQAGRVSAPVSVSYTTSAAPAGITGHDAGAMFINTTANTAGPFSGTIDVVAGQLVVLHIWAWTGAGGQTPSTQWTVQHDGVTLTPATEVVQASLNYSGAVYSFVAASTGTVTITVNLGGAGRACYGHRWKLSGFDPAAPIPSNSPNPGTGVDVTSITIPGAFTPGRNDNVILTSIYIRSGGLAAQVGVSGADGFVADETGTNATSDFTTARAWKKVNPAAATSFVHTWTTPARAGGLRTEINVAP